MTKKAKADYYSNLFDEVKTAAAYWRLLKKSIRNNKSKQTKNQLKKDDAWNPYNRWHWKGNYIKRLFLHSCWKIDWPRGRNSAITLS